jgi:hypothetical protein
MSRHDGETAAGTRVLWLGREVLLIFVASALFVLLKGRRVVLLLCCDHVVHDPGRAYGR